METGKIHKVPSGMPIGKQVEKPDFLYKYQAITDYSIQNLINGKLWSSFPENFNDPFEYKHNVVGEAGQTDWDKLYKSKGSLSVICLTEVPDDLLMWSHYANSHTGFCLKISISTLTTKVVYSDEYPTLDFHNDKTTQILNWHTIIHSKSKHWEYEKEWRMIFVDGERLREYPGKLVSIIFGARMTEENKRKIKGILKDSVNYYQAELSPNSYKINIEELDKKNSSDNQTKDKALLLKNINSERILGSYKGGQLIVYKHENRFYIKYNGSPGRAATIRQDLDPNKISLEQGISILNLDE